MFYRFTFPLLFFALFADADLPRVPPMLSGENATTPVFAPNDNIRLFPTMVAGEDQDGGKSDNAPAQKSSTLQESSKLDLIRYVSGEFAKARKPLPAGKDGFTLYVDKPFDQQFLDRAVATHGAAVNTGDKAQITKLEFHEHTIVVDVNGGGRQKKHWRDRIQIGFGSPYPMGQTTTTDPNGQPGPPGLQPGQGGTIFLQFPKSVPDLTPDELKKILDPFLDFGNQRSASVHWIDTLPPEMKKAITDRRPVVGMDRDEVVAAIGKPDRKVRERDANGNETEDWIYGHPPDKTIFVRFIGDRVTTIKQYPQ